MSMNFVVIDGNIAGMRDVRVNDDRRYVLFIKIVNHMPYYNKQKDERHEEDTFVDLPVSKHIRNSVLACGISVGDRVIVTGKLRSNKFNESHVWIRTDSIDFGSRENDFYYSKDRLNAYNEQRETEATTINHLGARAKNFQPKDAAEEKEDDVQF